MGTLETPIEMVKRHVLEGEKHLGIQAILIERLLKKGLPTKLAQALFEIFYVSQAEHVKHLRRILREREFGRRDEQGNLVPARIMGAPSRSKMN
jgi:hypothetical protein